LPSLAVRAAELLQQLGITEATDPKLGLTSAELGETALRTLRLPEIARLRPTLLSEVPIFGKLERPDREVLISGIADAISVSSAGPIEDVVDWKSDVDPTTATLNDYREQLATYRKILDAHRALLTLMTEGKVLELRDSGG
jgi:exodeoxyribonuclease-5